MSHAEIGDILYCDPDGDFAVRVVSRVGTLVGYVPIGSEVRHTHEGNLYDSHGNRPYYQGIF